MTVQMAVGRYYDTIATRYNRWIAPVVMPLIADLIASSPIPVRNRRAVDIGAGTGIGADLLIARGAQAIAMDLSGGMLHIGQSEHVQATPVAARVQADLMRAPFAAASFDLAVASFALNATDPAVAFKAIRQLLKPGGWLIGQEWAAQDSIAAAFDALIADQGAIVDDLRSALPERWSDVMQDVEDYRDRLHAAGFERIDVAEGAPIGVQLPLETFVGYRLAWLTEPTADRIAEIAEALRPFADREDLITWQPSLFRFRALHQMRNLV